MDKFKELRHKTAMKRTALSRPVASALRDGVLKIDQTFFDYGCGYGTDVEILKSTGVKSSGWDPYYSTKNSKVNADVVNLGYVLNVIEAINEREVVLKEAFSLCCKSLIVSVRIDDAIFQESIGDGGITRDGAFQKIYTQSEFRSFVEGILGKKLYIVEPGVGYVFKDEGSETEFKSNRYLGRLNFHENHILKQIHESIDPEKIKSLIEDLGRIPAQEEVGELSFLGRKKFKDFVESTILPQIDKSKFNESRKRLEEEILQALAMTRIENRSFLKLTQLSPNFQKTIRTLYPDYKEATRQAEGMLMSLGKEGEVARAGRSSAVGKLLPEDLYVHRSAIEFVPGLLKLMLSLAESIAGKINSDLIKFSLHGKSLSFLFYPEFDNDPHPKLFGSVKVDFRTGKFKFRDYQGSENPPILHRKEAFVMSSYPNYEAFKKLTEAEEKAGLLSSTGIGFLKQWTDVLQQNGYTINDGKLLKVDDKET